MLIYERVIIVCSVNSVIFEKNPVLVTLLLLFKEITAISVTAAYTGRVVLEYSVLKSRDFRRKNLYFS